MEWSSSSSPPTARWSHNGGDVSPLHLVITPSAPSRLSQANWNSLLSCLGVSAGGGGWTEWCPRGKAALNALTSQTHSVLLQSENNDLSVTAASSHPSYSRVEWLIDWLIEWELTSHNPWLYCSRLILQNISHLCCALCISQALAAYKHREFSDRLREMFGTF